jgi:anthranilate synthase component I
MNYHLHITHKKLLADTLTPVSIYLRIRDRFAHPILLESSDYHGQDNSFSYICCEPLATFRVQGDIIYQTFPDKQATETPIRHRQEVMSALADFSARFSVGEGPAQLAINGMFGYIAYDAVRYFEEIDLPNAQNEIPDMLYHVYRYVIAIDHFRNEMHLVELLPEGLAFPQGLPGLETLLQSKNIPKYPFSTTGQETSNYSSEEFLAILQKGKDHCLRGDVFQIVLSRRFSTAFLGDEFNVYRALRSINPSPYLFYFDYGNFKIFGSSPEAQLIIRNQMATIHPIAGTFKRTGHDAQDAELARQLALDEKENAEHVMLVDLARNDLSKNSTQVAVEVFKEVQFYSHVIHLVSKVTGKLDPSTSPLDLVAGTFPAGTLSGAPKHRAMQLIHQYEQTSRGYYGGAIGFMSFSGEFNHAIMIRSFLSKGNTLHFQAGAGVVAKSAIESELQEVNNKLEALRKAVLKAQEI